MKISKKVMAILLIMTLAIATSTVTFAAEDTTMANPVQNSTVKGASVGTLIASNSSVGRERIVVTVHLDKSYNGICFKAGATSNPDATYSCTVIYPDDKTTCRLLGNDESYADGSTTTQYTFDTGKVQAGDYDFVFTISDSDVTGCIGFIYTIY
ncbi:MAG: hypothetical protein ACLS95_07660 [Clostridia bacterium]